MQKKPFPYYLQTMNSRLETGWKTVRPELFVLAGIAFLTLLIMGIAILVIVVTL